MNYDFISCLKASVILITGKIKGGILAVAQIEVTILLTYGNKMAVALSEGNGLQEEEKCPFTTISA